MILYAEIDFAKYDEIIFHLENRIQNIREIKKWKKWSFGLGEKI